MNRPVYLINQPQERFLRCPEFQQQRGRLPQPPRHDAGHCLSNRRQETFMRTTRVWFWN